MDLMVDIETFSTRSRAVMHELGAVVFDPYGPALGDNPVPDQSFHILIDPQSCLELGMEVDWDTLCWWFKQSPLNLARVISGPRHHIARALLDFKDWIENKKPERFWGHGASFDPVILNEYYVRLRKESPFKDFRKIRDTRTLFDEVTDITLTDWENLTRKQISHHPLHDAWAQARTVQFVKQQIKMKGSDGNTTGARGIPRRDSSDASGSGAHSQVPATT